jgi:hypothetical protein
MDEYSVRLNISPEVAKKFIKQNLADAGYRANEWEGDKEGHGSLRRDLQSVGFKNQYSDFSGPHGTGVTFEKVGQNADGEIYEMKIWDSGDSGYRNHAFAVHNAVDALRRQGGTR